VKDAVEILFRLQTAICTEQIGFPARNGWIRNYAKNFTASTAHDPWPFYGQGPAGRSSRPSVPGSHEYACGADYWAGRCASLFRSQILLLGAGRRLQPRRQKAGNRKDGPLFCQVSGPPDAPVTACG
jgi:hypothetical protein